MLCSGQDRLRQPCDTGRLWIRGVKRRDWQPDLRKKAVSQDTREVELLQTENKTRRRNRPAVFVPYQPVASRQVVSPARVVAICVEKIGAAAGGPDSPISFLAA